MGTNALAKPRYTAREAELQDRDLGGRAPPHDLEKEAGIIGAMICFPETIDLAASLGVVPEDFYSESHRRIFEAIREVVAAGIALDMPALGTRLRDSGRIEQVGGSAYLFQLFDATCTPTTFAQYVADVKARSRLRALAREMQVRLAEIYTCDPGADVRAFADQIATGTMTNVAAIATDTAKGSHWKSFRDATVDFFQMARERGGEPPPSWGIHGMDAVLGGLHPGDLTIVAARPGAGKTALAMGVALAVASGKLIGGKLMSEDTPIPVVGVFALEMPADQLAGRVVCGDANIPMNTVRTGRLSDVDWKKLSKSASVLSKTSILFDDRSGASIDMVANGIKQLAATCLKAGKQLRLVIIDYLQLMRGTGKENNREQEIAGITRGLKGLAKDLRIPIIALSQINRVVETRSDKRPTMADLRESGAIEQDADNIVLLYRPGYYGEEGQSTRGGQKNAFQSPKPAGHTEGIVAKQRAGETGVVSLKFEPVQTVFVDAEEYEVREW